MAISRIFASQLYTFYFFLNLILMGISCGALILEYVLLRKGLRYLSKNGNGRSYKRAERWYPFYPTASLVMIPTLILIVMIISSPLPFYFTMFMIYLSTFIGVVIFIAFGVVGLIYYGLFIYKIGKEHQLGIFTAACVFSIILSYVGVGAILLYMGINQISRN